MRFKDSSDDFEIIDIVHLMTLVSVFCSFVFKDIDFIIFICILVFSVLSKRFRSSWVPWLIILVLLSINLANRWFELGNSVFLLFYWILALLLATFSIHPLNTLRKSARFLLVGIFLFASFWKIFSSEFRSGAFMAFYLQVDEGVGTSFLNWFTGMSNTEVLSNQNAIKSVEVNETVFLDSNQKVNLVAKVSTYTTIVLELLLWILFSIKRKQLAEFFLVLFMLATFLVVPAFTFAQILSCMAFTLTESKLGRYFYLLFFTVANLLPIRLWLF